MVRRDGNGEERAQASAEPVPRCTSPAGESPVRVITGEPGSRPAFEAERPKDEAWCRKPSAAQAVGGEQQRGPQHQVKPAASSELQSESRAEQVAAKATRSAWKSGYAPSLGGVEGAAGAEGEVRNTRGPSVPPTSGKERAYKPSAKARGAQRVAQRMSDRRVLKLLRSWLRAGVMEDGRLSETVSGTPQGGVISPLLSNIYLHYFDKEWTRCGRGCRAGCWSRPDGGFTSSAGGHRRAA